MANITGLWFFRLVGPLGAAAFARSLVQTAKQTYTAPPKTAEERGELAATVVRQTSWMVLFGAYGADAWMRKANLASRRWFGVVVGTTLLGMTGSAGYWVYRGFKAPGDLIAEEHTTELIENGKRISVTERTWKYDGPRGVGTLSMKVTRPAEEPSSDDHQA
jgi:hypothetical protein